MTEEVSSNSVRLKILLTDKAVGKRHKNVAEEKELEESSLPIS